jgi:hypothetical protein
MIELQKNIKHLVCGGVALLALTGANPAQAVSFVSTFRPPGNTTEVGTIDPTTGVYSPKGTFELQLTDIAVNQSGQVFGVTYSQLYALPAGLSSNASLQNYIPLAGGLELGVTGMNGLAFDNSNNLYGLAGRSPASGVGDPGFYRINTSTGAATLISNLGTLAPTAFGSVGSIPTGDTSDIVYNPNTGNFLAVSGNTAPTLFSINPTTGAIVGTPVKVTFNNNPLDFISGLTFDGGILRGYTTDKDQITIDPATGFASSFLPVAGITVLPDGSNFLVGGAASTPFSVTAVPEPSFAPGFIVLGACFGARFLVKRKKQPID